MSNLTEGYVDPWATTELPNLAHKKDSNVDSIKFNNTEWRNSPEIFKINREKAGMLSSGNIVYHSVESALQGARDFNKDASDYYQLLTGPENDDWSLVVMNTDKEIRKAGYSDFYKTDFMLMS